MSRFTQLTSSPGRPLTYILKDAKPVPESDPSILGAFLDDFRARNIGYTLLEATDGTKICISTNFMCVNARFGGGGPPLFWETSISWPGNEKWHDWQEYYAS